MRLFCGLLLLLALLGINQNPAAARSKPPLVLAAASLQESLTAAANAWSANGHPKPVLSFASSAALARQISAGAPADLFISADEAWMDAVADKGLIRPETRVSVLANKLVMVAPAASKAQLSIGPGFPLARALGTGRLAMADPDAVPAGKYGKAALVKLGIWRGIEAKVARAENVRAALALVERGEAPFGIVYATDAKATKAVRIVDTFPENTHPPIIYPIARLKTSTNAEAEGFRRFLLSSEGKAIFQRYGFDVR